MEPPGGRDSRFQLGYSMNLLSGESPPEIYGGGLGRPSTSLQQLSPRHTMVSNACAPRGGGGGGGGGGIKSDICYDERGMTPQHGMGFESGGVNEIHDESYSSMQSKKSPPSNGKKTKGRVKIKMEYIENKLRRYTTFSKRKTGIMKKAYELSTLTGTQVMLLVASETGHVYTFATRKLQPMITSEAGKALIQTCLNSPDPPAGSAGGDQRMSATGFEETELTYNISDEDSKTDGADFTDADEFDDDGSEDENEPPKKILATGSDGSSTRPFRSVSQDSHKSTDSSSSESKRLTIKFDDVKNTTELIPKGPEGIIINQLKQINNDLIQSNKAKAAQIAHTTTPPPTSSNNVQLEPSPVQIVSNNQIRTQMQQSNVTIQLDDNVKAVPLLVQSQNGMAFASVADGMILGMIQGSESKLVAIPINRNGNLSGADSSDSCSDDEMNGTEPEPLSVFVTPDHEVFSSISPPASPNEKKHQKQSSPSSTGKAAPSPLAANKQPLLGPLMYQTPQGMMYATPSNRGVLLSLAQPDLNNKAQFITIPLTMVPNNEAVDVEGNKKNK